MAKRYKGDDLSTVMATYSVNHPEWGRGHHAEYQWWKNARSKTAIPWGVDRDAAIIAAGAAFSVTVDATDAWSRECQFWANYVPTPAA